MASIWMTYDLIRELGRGSYGVVYEGAIKNTSTRVAIKRVSCQTPENVEPAVREFWALNAIKDQHPHVVHLRECLLQKDGVTERMSQTAHTSNYLELLETTLKGKIAFDPRSACYMWFVMEFCEAGDMNEYLLSRRPNHKTNSRFMLQLSSAVAFLHKNQIIHRDLKPANILISANKLDTDDSEPTLKIADFGLSKVFSIPGQTPGDPGNVNESFVSAPCGTSVYMAPEAWEGYFSAKADIFSMGIIIWGMQERITFVDKETQKAQLGSYIKRGTEILPIGLALKENPQMELVIPARKKSMNVRIKKLIKDMLAANPHNRPDASEVEFRLVKMSFRDSR